LLGGTAAGALIAAAGALAQPMPDCPGPSAAGPNVGYPSCYGPGSLAAAPVLALSFIDGSAIDPGITLVRGSEGTYFDATGSLQTAAANVPRYDYGPTPGGVTNWVRNSNAVGAVAGTPGTMPNFWSLGPTQVVGNGTEGGIPYVDLRFASSTPANGAALAFDATNFIAVAPGQSWTTSFYAKLVAGSLSAAGATLQITTRYYNSANVFVSQSLPTFVPTGAALNLQRFTATDTAPVGAAFAVPAFRYMTTGVYDFTLRIGAPQLELAAIANAWVPTSTGPVNVGAVPLGLLIEESRSNGVRNPRGEGGVAGSPAYPTNVVIGPPTGLTVNTIGSGSENGIPYWDVRFFGTASTTTGAIQLESTPVLPALNGQVWTGSAYVRLVGGTLANVTNFNMAMSQRTSANAFISADLTGPNFLPTSTPLDTQRYATTQTLNQATTAFVQPKLIFTCTAAAIDFTIRIGAPQLELGAFPTSVVLPIAGTPAVATRAADNAVFPFTPYGSNPTQSLVVEGIFPQVAPSGALAGVAVLDDGTAANRLTLRNQSASPLFNATSVVAGVTSYSINYPGTFAIGVPFKAGLAVTQAGGTGVLNGGVPGTAAGPTPTGLTTLRIGQNAPGSGYMNGWVRRIRYWPRALSNAELIAATT
jgi:hypothetical protein